MDDRTSEIVNNKPKQNIMLTEEQAEGMKREIVDAIEERSDTMFTFQQRQIIGDEHIKHLEAFLGAFIAEIEKGVKEQLAKQQRKS